MNRSAGAGNLSCVRLEHGLDHRPVAAVGPQLLRLVGVLVVDERLRRVIRLGCGGDRGLDQQRAVRNDVLDVLARVLGGDRLVLVGEQDVALAAEERPQRVARALVLNRDVLEQGLDVRQALLLGRALGQHLVAVGGHQVPAGAAGGERVRRQNLDVAGDQVIPGLDVLRVARADHEDDDGVLDDAVVLVFAPVLGHHPRVDQTRHVRLEREVNDVGGLAGLDRARLVARGAERVRELDALALRGGVEPGFELLGVGLLGSRVGDHVDRAAGAVGRAFGGASAGGDSEGEHGAGADGACDPGATAGPRVRRMRVRGPAAAKLRKEAIHRPFHLS